MNSSHDVYKPPFYFIVVSLFLVSKAANATHNSSAPPCFAFIRQITPRSPNQPESLYTPDLPSPPPTPIVRSIGQHSLDSPCQSQIGALKQHLGRERHQRIVLCVVLKVSCILMCVCLFANGEILRGKYVEAPQVGLRWARAMRTTTKVRFAQSDDLSCFAKLRFGAQFRLEK